MSGEQDAKEPEYPKEHYRDLAQARANGFTVDQYLVELWRREEEMVRALIWAPQQLISCGLTARHFSAPVHALAWTAVEQILEQIPDTESIDGAVLLAFIRRLEPGVLAGRRGQAWIDALFSEGPVPFEVALSTVAIELKQHWRIRAWSSRFSRLTSRVGKETNFATLQADFAVAGQTVSEEVVADQSIEKSIAEQEWNAEEHELVELVRTYMPQLDQAMGGGHGVGDMLAVGGGTSAGKSYFGIDWCCKQATNGHAVLLISAEDPKDLYYCRTLSRYTNPLCTPESLRMRRTPPDIVEDARRAFKEDVGDRFHLVVERKPTIDDVCRLIRTYKHVKKIRSVVVDYVQAVRDPEFPGNRVQEMSSVIMKLKKTCSDVKVALVILSQYARDDYKEGQEPGLNSFKYCGDIENEAEGVICLWRDKAGVLHLKIPKVKWTRARQLRYVVPVCQTTGNFMVWEDDFTEPEA